MTKVSVLSQTGASVGEIELNDAISESSQMKQYYSTQ